MKFLNKYTLLFLLLVTGIYACKKDLGNYTYKPAEIPVIDTTDIAPVYNVEQNQNLTVRPKISYTGDAGNLSYQWFTYVVSFSSYSTAPAKIISEKSSLDLNVDLAPGNYYLELVVTDKSNNLKITRRTLLNVLANMESGWLVLHSSDNKSEVDFIASKNLSPGGPNKRIKNLFQTVLGAKMDGEGQAIGYSRQNNSAFNWITVGTDQGIKRLNGFTFALLGTDNELFRRPLTAKNFQAHINNGSNELVIDEGQLMALPWGREAQDVLYNAPFQGDYYLAPYIVYNNYSEYGGLVYDQKYGKFLYTTTNLPALRFAQFKSPASTTPVQAFDPSQVGKDLLFMDRGFNKNAFAFFKDRSGSGRYLYVLDLNQSDQGNLALAAYDMSAQPEITDAKFFQVGDIGNIALYATGNTVYKYDYSGTQNSSVVFKGFPVGETITCMKIFKPKLNVNSNTTEFATTNNAVIYVATWNGTEGKLYELAMNVASGIINPVPLNVYDGFGKIKDMVAKFRGSGL